MLLHNDWPLSSFVKQRLVISENQHLLSTDSVIRLRARHITNITLFHPYGSPIVGEGGTPGSGRLRTCPGLTAGICTQVIQSLPPRGDGSPRNLGSLNGQLPWPAGWPLKLCRPARPSLQPWSSGNRNRGPTTPLGLKPAGDRWGRCPVTALSLTFI